MPFPPPAPPSRNPNPNPMPNPFRAPPSSQPAPATRPRAQSNFPSSSQRPRLPISGLTAVRLIPSALGQSQAQTQSRSQRPPNLDVRYSPPSSQAQASQLFDPIPSSQPPLFSESQAQVQAQSRPALLRERAVSRPPSSLAGPRNGPSQRPSSCLSQRQAPVDQYRPAQPRTGADVYQGDRSSVAAPPPKAQKGAEILDNLAGLRTWLEDKFAERQEEEKEAKENLEERFKSLEDENKDLKERLHELAMGQKILPTREELSEEITGQLSPALHEFFGTLDETLRTSIAPLPENVAKLSARKVKLEMLEMQDTARKEALKEGAAEPPLMGLLDHLIQRLGPLDDITATLASLSGLPDALEQVAVFRNTMEAMQARFASRPIEPRQIEQVPPIEVSTYHTQMTQLQQSLDQIKSKVDNSASSSHGSQDEGKVLAAIADLKGVVEQLSTKGVSTPGQPSSTNEDDISAIKEMVSALKEEMMELKRRAVPLMETPGSVSGLAKTNDTEMRTLLQSILAELRGGRGESAVASAVPVGAATQHLPTPDTALRPASTAITQVPPSQPTRMSTRPVKPTSKARQDPPTLKAITKRARDPLSLLRARPASTTADPSTVAEEHDIFGSVQAIHPPPAQKANPGVKRKADTNPVATHSTIAEALALHSADPPTPPRPRPREQEAELESTQTSSRNTSNGSVSRQSKKRKTSAAAASNGDPNRAGSDSNSLEVKAEALESLKGLGQFRPITRSDATKAREIGIEIIDLASSDGTTESNNGSGSGSQGRKKSTGAVKTYGSSHKRKSQTRGQGHKKMGKGRVSSAATPATTTSAPGDAMMTAATVVATAAPPESLASQIAISNLIDSQSQSLPETQPQPQTQTQAQTQEIEPTQLNESQGDSISDCGHGQPLSVPSLPAYESTEGLDTQTQIDTYVPHEPTYQDKGKGKGKDKEPTNKQVLTSSEQVEQSLMIKQTGPCPTPRAQTSDERFLAQLGRPRGDEMSIPPPPPVITPKRPEPSYRKFQKPKSGESGSASGSRFGGLFGSLSKKQMFSMLETSDDED